jgi:hypothetical protein
MILGIAGYARVGKDTTADFLVTNHGFKKMSFADPMREALLRLNPLITISGNYVELATAVRLSGWEELKTLSPDVRPLMQRLGTEVGRNMFGQNFWVDLALKEAQKHENVVFADVRFQNEAQAIKDLGGEVWRVEREGYLPANDHISEHDMDDFSFDYIIRNDYDLNVLESLTNHLMDVRV